MGIHMLSAKFYTIHEVAELLAVGDATVRSWVNKAELRAVKLDREFRIAKVDLEAFITARITAPLS